MMRNFVIAMILSMSFTFDANSAITTYSDYTSFLSALPSPASTLDFDSLSAGSTINDGATVDGVTFNYDFGDVQLTISDVFSTTSSPNFLGTNDSGVLQDGDNFGISFEPSYAIGMFFITADEMFDDDIILSAAGASAGLVANDAGADLGDGGIPYFLGIIDDMNTITSAEITTIGGGFFLYNIDDITTTVVPLPAAFIMFLSGLLGLFLRLSSAN